MLQTQNIPWKCDKPHTNCKQFLNGLYSLYVVTGQKYLLHLAWKLQSVSTGQKTEMGEHQSTR